jgi:Prenyltransferase and squalene oxidase repeat
MRIRRQFWACGVALGLSLGSVFALRALSDEPQANGNQSKGMISAQAQDAIDAGLAYLARSQHADGSFGTHQHRGNVAITSLGALAFMAGGHQPGRGRYGQCVTRALKFVLDQEKTQPLGFLHNATAILHGPMYGHGFGTLFLAEAHGTVHTKELKKRLRKTLEHAVQLIIKTQNPEGGWRYHPQPADADISVTICQIMALRAARNAGIAVPREVADKCTKYVKDCQDMRDGGFRYMRHHGPTGFAKTAAGVVALYSAGVYKGHKDYPAVEKGLQYLRNNCRPGRQVGGFRGQDMMMHYYYGHYYAVQAMWTAGNPYWGEWYPAIRDELLNTADRNREEGSWYDRRICPHYCTAMACIILQVPNNYLPILQR